MWERGRTGLGLRPRDAIVVLTLISHLFVTLGFPLLPPGSGRKNSSIAYPCQTRPCGCLTAEACWKGDCCCFTIEEKLTWAEANGVEPPEHVRPLVESRRSRPTPPKKKSCCTESEPVTGLSVAARPSCCENPKPVAGAECRTEKPACEAERDADCLVCVAKSKPDRCEKKAPPADPSGVRWVLGIFAQKCRGEGPVGLIQLDPAVVPDLTPLDLTEPERGDHAAPCSEQAASRTHVPPTRPPRSS